MGRDSERDQSAVAIRDMTAGSDTGIDLSGPTGGKIQAATPKLPATGSNSAEKSPGTFDWLNFIGLTVHPLKIAVIEALLRIGQPLSIRDLAEMLSDAHYDKEMIKYHVGALVELGVIHLAEVRRVRGAFQNRYWLV